MDLEQIKEWLKSSFEKGKFSHKLDPQIIVDENRQRVELHLLTAKHTYRIIATQHGYLGCTMTNRYPNEGENWLRGSDLADGNIGEKTLHQIMYDILSCELEYAV